MDLPRAATAAAAGEPVTARYDTELTLEEARMDGVETMRYASPVSDGLSFLAISTPGPGGIPLALLDRGSAGLVFSLPPLVVMRQGRLELRFDAPATGWMTGGNE